MYVCMHRYACVNSACLEYVVHMVYSVYGIMLKVLRRLGVYIVTAGSIFHLH